MGLPYDTARCAKTDASYHCPMKRGAVEIAQWLADGAEKARQAGDVAASLALSVKAAEYLQLARILEDALAPPSKEPPR